MRRRMVGTLGLALGTLRLATGSPSRRAVLSPILAALVFALGVLAWPPSGVSEFYAVNKAVSFVPYPDGWLRLAETSVTDQDWSVRNATKP